MTVVDLDDLRKAPPVNPRQLARHRNRQVLAGSLVAFGATVGLVMANPMAADTSATSSSAEGPRTAGAPAGIVPDPVQAPAPTTFFRSGGGSTAQGPVPATNLRPGGRTGVLRSRGS
jgi:hypothetical protein